jgi:hypothetical protein
MSLATLVAVSVLALSPATGTSAKNFLLVAVDDLRPMFGASFGVEEV